jgi:hypothetical protein
MNSQIPNLFGDNAVRTIIRYRRNEAWADWLWLR